MSNNTNSLINLRKFITDVKTELELATERSLIDSREETGRALKTARDQAAADLETFSTKLAHLAGKTAVQIAEAREQFQDQRELCQKHAYSEREDLETRVDADIHTLSERLHVAESLPPISDAAKFVEACQDVKDQLLQNRKAFEEEFSRLQAKVGADIHALSQRVYRAESLPPISDAQDILQQAAEVKNACHESRKAFEEDFSRLQSRLQTNIGSLTKRVRTLESTPAPWNLHALELKQTALELRTEALERTANAHPDTDHEVFANDFARVDERLDALECEPPDHRQAAIDEAKELLREDLVTHQDRLKHQAEASHLEHEVRIQSLERRAVLRTVDPAGDLDTALAKLIRQFMDTMNLAILKQHPPWLPGFTITKDPKPGPPT